MLYCQYRKLILMNSHLLSKIRKQNKMRAVKKIKKKKDEKKHKYKNVFHNIRSSENSRTERTCADQRVRLVPECKKAPSESSGRLKTPKGWGQLRSPSVTWNTSHPSPTASMCLHLRGILFSTLLLPAAFAMILCSIIFDSFSYLSQRSSKVKLKMNPNNNNRKPLSVVSFWLAKPLEDKVL